VTGKEPLDQLVDVVLGGAPHRPVWGQHPGRPRARRGFNERRFRKGLRAYWGVDADPMRVSLAVQDASFVAGVVQTVSEALQLGAAGTRRVATAMVRSRVLAEPVADFEIVERAWRAWWPPPPGEDGKRLFAEFMGAWRDWLEGSAP
jgi:hypothetical protein